jgi:hypothetical protein
MAIVDSLSSPASATQFDANADCHIITTFTNENGKNVQINIRYEAFNDLVMIACRADGPNSLKLQYYDGSTNDVAEVTGVFDTDVEYRVDIYANGSNIVIDVDDVELINETVTHNQAVAKGRITHNLDTNDIELESWPYGEPVEGVDVVQSPLGTLEVTGYEPVVTASADVTVAQSPLGTLEITGFNPVVDVSIGDWEIGAYIYTAIGGVDVNVTLGTLSIIGYGPIVTYPVDVAATFGTLEVTGYDPFVTVPVGVTSGLGTLEIASFNPTVSASLNVLPSLGLLSITGYNPSVTASGGVGVGAGGITRIALRTVHLAH